MDKYIKLDWPESQKFIDTPELSSYVYYSTESGTIFIEENKYNDIIKGKVYPKVYNTNLGKIICFNDYAIVNDITYLYDESIEKGDKVLVYNHNTEDWTIEICKANQKGFPILFENSNILEGFTHEIIGVNKKLPF